MRNKNETKKRLRIAGWFDFEDAIGKKKVSKIVLSLELIWSNLSHYSILVTKY